MVQLINKSQVEDLRVAENPDITQFEWKVLLKAISQQPTSLKHLDISSNSLGKYGTVTGSPLLALGGMKLDSLNLTNSQLSDDHVERLSDELRKTGTIIKELKLLPGNNINDQSVNNLKNAASQ